MKMNKKMVVALCACAVVGSVFAGPHGFGGHRGGYGARPMHHHSAPPVFSHYHHHHSGWGPGGSHFWPGFLGGVVGGIVGSAIVEPAPVVVTTPTVVTTTPTVVMPAPVVAAPVAVQPATTVQNVWVEGCYIDQVQSNGSVTRVWNPGHYEQRTVTVR